MNRESIAAVYRWPLLLGTLFLLFLLFCSWSIYLAGTRSSPVLDRDYYQSGQNYPREERERQAAQDAGWRVTLARDGELMRVRLVDGRGLPVDARRVTLRALRPQSESGEHWGVEFAPAAPGVYQARVAELPPESTEIVLTASAAGARLDRRFKARAEQWPELVLPTGYVGVN